MNVIIFHFQLTFPGSLKCLVFAAGVALYDIKR